MQFTKYGVGQFYGWHNDAGLSQQYKPVTVGNQEEGLEKDFIKENTEMIRKLSFTIQLSDPDDYEGGNVILLSEEGNKYVAPRQKGTIILFDSRTQHCVNKVKKGVRKSIVGWVVGPRWK